MSVDLSLANKLAKLLLDELEELNKRNNKSCVNQSCSCVNCSCQNCSCVADDKKCKEEFKPIEVVDVSMQTSVCDVVGDVVGSVVDDVVGSVVGDVVGSAVGDVVGDVVGDLNNSVVCADGAETLVEAPVPVNQDAPVNQDVSVPVNQDAPINS